MRLLLLGLIALAVGVQHEGQLEYCVNHGLSEKWPQTPAHTCECAKPCAKDQPEDPRCRKYCQKDDCHCVNTKCETN